MPPANSCRPELCLMEPSLQTIRPIFLGGWGWDWGLGGYGNSGYGGNNTVVVFPQAIPQAANVTGSVDPAPCKWNQQDFTVPSSAGGARPVQVVSCH